MHHPLRAQVIVRLAGAALAAVTVVVACSGDDGTSSPTTAKTSATSPDAVGQTCSAASACYPNVDRATIHGDVQCLDRVTGGYCTHLCTTDADCCATPGECVSGFKQVCAPFESTGQNMCFFSCESDDLHAAPDGGVLDDTAYCTTHVSTAFACRSTGGGSKNRKVCVP